MSWHEIGRFAGLMLSCQDECSALQRVILSWARRSILDSLVSNPLARQVATGIFALFAATSVGVIAFIAAFHMTDAFVLRERSIAYDYSVASEVRSGGIQLAVLRSCSSRPAECIDGWREVPNGLAFDDYLGCQGHESAGWLALTKAGTLRECRAGRRCYRQWMARPKIS